MDRRVFFSRMAVGGTTAALAGGGAWMFGSRSAQAQVVVNGQSTDAVFGEAINQLQAAVHAAQGEPSGEALRMAAAANRLLAAWSKDKNFDARVRATVRNALRRHGRSALVLPQFDVQQELKARGLPVPPGTVLVPPTTATLSAVLSRLETHGATTYFEGLAALLAQGAARADKRAGGMRRIRDDDADHALFCKHLLMSIDICEAMVILFCNPLMLWGIEICMVASAEYVILLAIKWAEGCA